MSHILPVFIHQFFNHASMLGPPSFSGFWECLSLTIIRLLRSLSLWRSSASSIIYPPCQVIYTIPQFSSAHFSFIFHHVHVHLNCLLSNVYHPTPILHFSTRLNFISTFLFFSATPTTSHLPPVSTISTANSLHSPFYSFTFIEYTFLNLSAMSTSPHIQISWFHVKCRSSSNFVVRF